MKRIILSIFITLFAVVLFAQKDVTTFLGIPVDGTKMEMTNKLINKGYVLCNKGTKQEHLEGEFNGRNVNIYIATNNNKVYRVMVSDAQTTDEANIKIQYNNLVNQFEKNKRYSCFDKFTIPEDEKIYHEIAINKKTYDAQFFQNPIPEKVDTLSIVNEINERLTSKYTEEQLQNPTEEMKKDFEDIKYKVALDLIYKKSVWFRIYQDYGDFYISIYYDNEYNKANGEDL